MMKPKTLFAALLVSAFTLAMVAGCGVPKSEHEKVVKELEQANQEKATLTTQVAQAKKEKDDAVAQLQGSINALKKENEELKAKLAPKKPAAKPAAKAPAKPAAKAPVKK